MRALSLSLFAMVSAVAAAHAENAVPAAPAAHQGTLEIQSPWVRQSAPGVSVTAGYVRITNTGTVAERLTGATLQGAAKGELHQSVMEGDIMKMRPLADGLVIAPKETVELKPGGAHLMFMGLTVPLDAGKPAAGTLKFANAGEVAVEFQVEPLVKGAANGEQPAQHPAH